MDRGASFVARSLPIYMILRQKNLDALFRHRKHTQAIALNRFILIAGVNIEGFNDGK